MDRIFELSMRWQKNRHFLIRLAGKILYLIPKAYAARLSKPDKKHKDVEKEIQRRMDASLEKMNKGLKNK